MKKQKLKVNIYEIVSRAVDNGIEYGWNRAHKHTSNPSEGALKSEIENAVMNELCEVIDFD